MTLDDVLKELERVGTAQNRKIYARHGVCGAMYGVSSAELNKLRKRIKVDHALALGLWASGNHDARVLATKIDDAKQVTTEQATTWAGELTNYVITDAFSGLIARTPLASELMARWVASEEEWIGCAGWNVLGQLALDDRTFDDAFFEAYLPMIEERIHQARNRTRYSMNMALIAIGTRSDLLEKSALATARRIGAVHVDHGETGCKTPDAGGYIVKARAHRRSKEQNAN